LPDGYRGVKNKDFALIGRIVDASVLKASLRIWRRPSEANDLIFPRRNVDGLSQSQGIVA
jgi:hypothetical protein